MVGKTSTKAVRPTGDTSLGSALKLEIIPSLIEAFTASGMIATNGSQNRSLNRTNGGKNAPPGTAKQGNEKQSAVKRDTAKQGTVKHSDQQASVTTDSKHSRKKAGSSARRLTGVTTQQNVNLPSLKSTPRTKHPSDTAAATSATNPAQRTNADHLSKARIDNWISTDEFALMVMADEGQQAQSLVNTLRDADIPDEAILLELLAPTGAVLGRLWEQDLSSFAEITVGVCRLHAILRALHPTDRRTLEKDAHGGRALLVNAPGEQHSFGLIMVSELLFRSGWCVDVHVEADQPKVLDVLARQWFEFVGISLSGETHIEATAKLIDEIKRKSCNPAVAVVMGGHIFSENPKLGSQLGADKVVLDGAEVTNMTEQYIPTQKVM